MVSCFEALNTKIPWRVRSQWEWLQERLLSITFKVGHIYREENTVADAISKYPNFRNYIWRDVIPDFIYDLAAKDRYMEYFRYS